MMKNQADVIIDWEQHQLREDISIISDQQIIDLHPRTNGPHAFFASDIPDRRNQYLANTLQLFAAKYSPSVLNVYGIDTQKGPLYQAIYRLPHCSGMTAKGEKVALAFHAIKQELIRRQKLLSTGYYDAYGYLRTVNQNVVREPMSILFIAIADIDCITQNEVLLRQLLESIRISRALGVHFLLTGRISDLVVNLQYMIQTQFNLDHENNAVMPINLKFASQIQVPQLEEQVHKSWHILSDDGEEKTLELINGDLCELQKSCDIVVCSAFKNDYYPMPGTLIGSLARKGIWVDLLAKEPELDFKKMGCWLSKDTNSDYRRIACVELLDTYAAADPNSYEVLLKRTFSTLRYLLEQAQIMGLPVETVALPILGCGNQGLELGYVLSTLVCQCRQILKTNLGVKRLVFYEIDSAKYNTAAKVLNRTLTENTTKLTPKVFISYSSKQSELACVIRDLLEKHSIPCWMAPDSIPSGSDYQEIIPIALNQIDMVLLILTPDAEQSRWVRKEIGTAIGANKVLLPYQVNAYAISQRFRFLLDGEQILENDPNSDPSHQQLIQRVLKILTAK